MPYALDQLTGGLSEGAPKAGVKLVSEGKAPTAKGLIPFSEVKGSRAVDEVFEKLKEMEGERIKIQRQGKRYEREKEYQKVNDAAEKIAELARASRGDKLVAGKVVKSREPDEAQKAVLRQKAQEAARKALAK